MQEEDTVLTETPLPMTLKIFKMRGGIDKIRAVEDLGRNARRKEQEELSFKRLS